MDRERAIVVSLGLPRKRRGGAVMLGFRQPRSTLLLPLPGPAEGPVALAVRSFAAEDATVVVARPELRPALRSLLPRAEVFVVDPARALRFLWWFRDAHDPLALGHAGERRLFDEAFLVRPVPTLDRCVRGTWRRNLGEVRGLLLDLGAAIGVRPPPSAGADDPGGPGPVEAALVLEACVGLYVGLLHRWGSPLAVPGEEEGELRLADRFLADRGRPLPGGPARIWWDRG